MGIFGGSGVVSGEVAALKQRVRALEANLMETQRKMAARASYRTGNDPAPNHRVQAVEEDVAALESKLSRQVAWLESVEKRLEAQEEGLDNLEKQASSHFHRLRKRVEALEGAEASEEADTDEVEALAEAAYTAQVQSIFQEWPCRGQPYMPWSGLEESVKGVHRAAVRAVLRKQREEG